LLLDRHRCPAELPFGIDKWQALVRQEPAAVTVVGFSKDYSWR